jgi:hypothetical protein
MRTVDDPAKRQVEGDCMTDEPHGRSPMERRSEVRRPAEAFHSVEINLGGVVPVYRFGLRDISENGACILVADDSPILPHLAVGRTLSMKFFAHGRGNPAQHLRAEIRHITPGQPGNLDGLHQVGIRIVDRKTTPDGEER